MKNEKNKKPYNLEDRTRNFFLKTVRLCRKIPKNCLTERQISQLVASSGSVSANYCEASEAMSKKDFNKSIKICRKEAKKSRSWLLGLEEAACIDKEEFSLLENE